MLCSPPASFPMASEGRDGSTTADSSLALIPRRAISSIGTSKNKGESESASLELERPRYIYDVLVHTNSLDGSDTYLVAEP